MWVDDKPVNDRFHILTSYLSELQQQLYSTLMSSQKNLHWIKYMKGYWPPKKPKMVNELGWQLT